MTTLEYPGLYRVSRGCAGHSALMIKLGKYVELNAAAGLLAASSHRMISFHRSRYASNLSALRITLTLVLVLLAVDRGHGGTYRCPADIASVIADHQDSIQVVCDAAGDAIRLLGNCGVMQHRPFRVFVVAELPEECPEHALAFFDRRTEKVVVTTYDKCVQIVAGEGRFGMPMTHNLYHSLLVHEFAHAIVGQNTDTTTLNVAGHEYIAYAIQLASMDPKLRARVLQNYRQKSPVILEHLNESYFYFSPPKFAVKSYIHFKAPANGCGFIRDLLQGKKKLPSGLR